MGILAWSGQQIISTDMAHAQDIETFIKLNDQIEDIYQTMIAETQ